MTAFQNDSTLSFATAYYGCLANFEGFSVPEFGLHFSSFELATRLASSEIATATEEKLEKIPPLLGWKGQILKVRLRYSNSKIVAQPDNPGDWSEIINSAIRSGHDCLFYNPILGGKMVSSPSCVVWNLNQIKIVSSRIRFPLH